MKITEMKAINFRLLSNSKLDLNEKMSLLIGENNSGKTSFLILFDKFYAKTASKINFDDFSKNLRQDILDIEKDINENKLSIRLLLSIEYKVTDNLENIAEFITDLKSPSTIVKFALEAGIQKNKLIDKLQDYSTVDEKHNFIRKNLSEFIKYEVYIFNEESDFETANRYKLIKKDIEFVRNLINFQIIHAKRNVASSEEIADSKRILSKLTTKYFNSRNELLNKDVAELNASMQELDEKLNKKYEIFFYPFLKNVNTILDMHDLRVTSDLESKSLLAYSSKIVYGEAEADVLPEHLNGLGYMNILYLLLNIEINKENFKQQKKDINIFCIEEPEAHTHPQMQYIFAREIRKILNEVPHLQTIITSHSSYIVAQSNFSDIKYFQKETNKETGHENIKIKNFENEMKKVYRSEDDIKLFNFLQKYLSIQSSEMFFASKVIFIEGISEKILIYYFMNQHDENIRNVVKKERAEAKSQTRQPNEKILELENHLLLSQNITILEVGANAKAFKHFIDFLGVKSLIITDIDSVDNAGKKVSVIDGIYSSNATLKDYLTGGGIKGEKEKKEWFLKLKSNTLDSEKQFFKITYQTCENLYHARSFEDAFINVNLSQLIEFKDDILGLKCTDKLIEVKNQLKGNEQVDIYKLVYGIPEGKNDSLVGGIMDTDEKSNFASSIYYLSVKNDITWTVPGYIKEGLEWIAK